MPKRQYHIVDGRVIGETSGGVRTDYLRDALGSVTGTVNQSAQVRNTYRWKPYGSELASTGPDPDPGVGWNGTWGYRPTNRLRASHYVLHRHYDQLSGQWTTTDPIERFTPYWYGNQNPATMIDPLGLHTCEDPRTKDCLPDIRPYDTYCGNCTLEHIGAQANAHFHMVLPRKMTLKIVIGVFEVHYLYTFTYHCPDGKHKIRTQSGVFSVPATSAGPRRQTYGTWWQTNHIIPPSDAIAVHGKRWTIQTLKCRDVYKESDIPATQYGGEQYFIPIDPDLIGNRGDFGIHPDGRSQGTNGCIVPDQINLSYPRKVRSCLQNLADYGVPTMELFVQYA
ncbi:MAG: hypothetical protein HONBIEJF_02598 [Fimbriimonadaceae bacterium]|nr:hypothetical protein [Fimbriimonadaceae bacterium]